MERQASAKTVTIDPTVSPIISPKAPVRWFSRQELMTLANSRTAATAPKRMGARCPKFRSATASRNMSYRPRATRIVDPLTPGSILANAKIAPTRTSAGIDGSTALSPLATKMATIATNPATNAPHQAAPAGSERPSMALTSGIWHRTSMEKKNSAGILHRSMTKSRQKEHATIPTTTAIPRMATKRTSFARRLTPERAFMSLSY